MPDYLVRDGENEQPLRRMGDQESLPSLCPSPRPRGHSNLEVAIRRGRNIADRRKPPSSYDQIARSPELQLRRYQKTWHGVLTQVIKVDGDHAEGEVYCLARHIWTASHNTPGDMPFSLSHDMTIRYQDEYRKDDGEWKFTVRKLTIDLRTVSQVELFSGSIELDPDR